MRLQKIRWSLGAAALGGLVVLAACAPWPITVLHAATAGGVPVRIDQATAHAGGITRGDAPGFPVTLATPGHYRLASDLVVPADSPGVLITAAGVTLDLNGFAIRGPVTCTGQAEAVRCDAQPRHSANGVQASAAGAMVRNGSVRGFAGMGVLLDREGQIEDMQVSDNAGIGVYANTSASRPVQVRRVLAQRNGADGFWLQTGSIEQSRAEQNGRTGFALGALMTLHESRASGNKGLDGDALFAALTTTPTGRQRETASQTRK
ncbi:MAG TPA: right-handed parallel beta-helix repeat-containing protein [Burkholderiaceae bacterium]|nr:right-handed parallel beta-helix repeat-containing protein [Burkholderiaceae bacterium]